MANEWIVHCIVPASRTHEMDRMLQEFGARDIMFRPYQNGLLAIARKMGELDDKPKKTTARKASGKGMSKVEVSVAQQSWIESHVTGKVKIPELREGWVKAGFLEAGLGRAMSRAADLGTLKRLGGGYYAPKGRA